MSSPNDADTVVIPPAPGDIEEVLAERAALEYGGHRSMTLVGGFGLAEIRLAALAAMAPEEHLPFPLVRRLGAQ
jgi:hypothetical protein